MSGLQGGQVIEGGPVILDAIPRHVNPFGQTRRVQTDALQAAVTASSAGDVLYLDPTVSYTENVVIATAGLTLIGLGARGQAYLNPAAGGGLQITADDTVLINLGVAGASAADYALNIKGASECRLYGCKLEGPDGDILLLDGDASSQVSNLILDDIEFAWGGTGIGFESSGYGFPTQIRVRGGLMHNLTASGMRGVNAVDGGFRDLWVRDMEFGAAEDGTEPTVWLDLADAGGTGMFSGNRFATATNATGILSIAAGVQWCANATEAGWSTGRPS